MSYPLADFVHAVRPRVDARLLPSAALDCTQQVGQWFPFARDVRFRCRLAAEAPLADISIRISRADAARASLPDSDASSILDRVLEAFRDPTHALFLAGELVTLEYPALAAPTSVGEPTIFIPLPRQIGTARRAADGFFDEVLEASHADTAKATTRRCFEWAQEGGVVESVGFGALRDEPFFVVRMVNVVPGAIEALLQSLGLAAEEPAVTDTVHWLSLTGRLGVSALLGADGSALVSLECAPEGRALGPARCERILDALEWRGLVDSETRASLTLWSGRDSARSDRLRGTLLGRALARLPSASEASFARRVSHFELRVPSVAGRAPTLPHLRTEAMAHLAVSCELTRAEEGRSASP